MSSTLREVIAGEVERVPAPVGDLDAVRSRGRRIRRRRRAVASTAVVVVLAVLGGAVALGTSGTDGDDDRGVDPVGSLDLSEGVRAVASPGGEEIHLGGRRFSADQLPGDLDTDATVTAAGVVFYRSGDPYLLDEDGEVRRLDEAAHNSGTVRPTSKSDGAVVAYGLPADGGVEVVVRDLETDEELGRRLWPCRGEDCAEVVIDAVDGGAVFVRTLGGPGSGQRSLGVVTEVWDLASGTVEQVADPGTRVADVRNGVLLYDGPRPETPTAARYRMVPGAIDAQLTLDGRYVVSWSSRLAPTTPGDDPVVLAQPRPRDRLAFWAIDTDGTVLVAVPDREGPLAQVYDCPVSGAPCDLAVPDLDSSSGDPVFIGTDM